MVNASGEELSELVVDLPYGTQRHTFTGLRDGARATFSFRSPGDGCFAVRGRLASGRIFSDGCVGYFMRALLIGERHEMRILPQGQLRSTGM